MRMIGLILVLLGGLSLGYREYESRTLDVEPPEANQSATINESWYPTPVAGGIALVSGLLLLASSSRREES